MVTFLCHRIHDFSWCSTSPIHQSSRHEHVTSMLRHLHWIRSPERIDFKLAVLVYRCLHGLVPRYLSYYIQRVADSTAAVSGPWVPAGMGKGGTCPLWKCCKVFCALVVTAKRSVDELFMHFFTTCRRLLGALSPEPNRGSILGPRGDFFPRPLICPPLEKKSCGGHAPVVVILTASDPTYTAVHCWRSCVSGGWKPPLEQSAARRHLSPIAD